MCQNVNIIVYIWSPNLAICAIAKIGVCTRLMVPLPAGRQLSTTTCCFPYFCSSPDSVRRSVQRTCHWLDSDCMIWRYVEQYLRCSADICCREDERLNAAPPCWCSSERPWPSSVLASDVAWSVVEWTKHIARVPHLWCGCYENWRGFTMREIQFSRPKILCQS